MSTKSFKGYTLIELLIVITITSIIFGVGIAGYREFSRRQSLTGVLKKTKADLRLAQQLAITGQKPTDVTCPILNGYTFTRNSASSYQIIASCSNGNTVIKDVDMPSDTTISAGSVTFKVLAQGTNISAPLTFTIANTANNATGTVVVGTGGDIQ